MPSKLFFKIFISLFLLSLLFFTYFYLYKESGVIDSNQDTIVAEGLFGEENSFVEPNEAANNFIRIKYFDEIDSNLVNAWVAGLNSSENSLILDFDYLNEFSTTKEVEVSCKPEDSAIFYVDLTYISSGVSIMDVVKPGDYIYSYCSDAECTSFINMCVLLVT